jgi:hypothetical protein
MAPRGDLDHVRADLELGERAGHRQRPLLHDAWWQVAQELLEARDAESLEHPLPLGFRAADVAHE